MIASVFIISPALPIKWRILSDERHLPTESEFRHLQTRRRRCLPIEARDRTRQSGHARNQRSCFSTKCIAGQQGQWRLPERASCCRRIGAMKPRRCGFANRWTRRWPTSIKQIIDQLLHSNELQLRWAVRSFGAYRQVANLVSWPPNTHAEIFSLPMKVEGSRGRNS